MLTGITIIVAVLFLLSICLGIVIAFQQAKIQELTPQLRQVSSDLRELAEITPREYEVFVGDNKAFVYMIANGHRIFIKKFDDEDMEYNIGLANELAAHLNEEQ